MRRRGFMGLVAGCVVLPAFRWCTPVLPARLPSPVSTGGWYPDDEDLDRVMQVIRDNMQSWSGASDAEMRESFL